MFKSSSSKRNHKDNLHLANIFVSFLLLASMLLSSCGATGSEGSKKVTPVGSSQESVVATQTAASSQSQTNGSQSTYTPPAYTRPTPVTAAPSESGTQSTLMSSVEQSMAQSSMMFIENEGQFDSGARFEVPGQQGTMYLADDAIWLSLVNAPVTDDISTTSMESAPDLNNAGSLSPAITATPSPDSEKPVTGVNVRLSFEGANSKPTIEGFDPLDTKVSYFIGNDPSKWHAAVPVWGGVRYKDIYPGYDLELTSQDGVWTWNLVQSEGTVGVTENGQSAPQAGKSGTQNKTANLRLQVEGAQSLALDGNAVKITTDAGEVELPLPTFEQSAQAEGITPQIKQSSTANSAYLDGNDVVLPISVPTSGGNTTPKATGTPIGMKSNGVQLIDRFVSQHDQTGPIPTLNSLQQDNGNLFYSTYLGPGGGTDISVDAAGNAYIVGTEGGTSFPTTPGAFQTTIAGGYDAFATKLNADGSGLIYSTFIGGSDEDDGNDIALGNDGCVYIIGRTLSTNFPTTIGAYDRVSYGSEAFITKLNASGTALEYSTYLGIGGTQGFHIAVNSSGNAYVVGQTATSSFPTTSGAYDRTHNGGLFDGFVTEFNTTGSGLVFSTFIGGNNADCEVSGDALECDIALGPDNSVYVAGVTASPNFPTTSGAYDRTYNGNSDLFALRLSADGSSLIYSTFLGGSSTDDCGGYCSIAVDANGDAYVAGATSSTNYPVTSGAYDTTYNGGRDISLTKLSANGSSLIYSTYLGNTGDDMAKGVSVSVNGEAVLIGSTTSSAFPVTVDAFQTAFGGVRDAFIARFSADGAALGFSTYLGGSNDDVGNAVIAKGNRDVYVSGWASSGDFPITTGAYRTNGNAFVARIAAANAGAQVYEGSTYDNGVSGCQKCAGNTQGIVGGPINTRTGGESYQVDDLSMSTTAGQLTFERTYSSLTTDLYTTDLGYGWTDSLDTRLIFPSDPNGETGYVLFKEHSANLYRFTIDGDSGFSADLGVSGTLALVNGNYILTLPDQSVYTFDSNGKVLTFADAEGHTWEYSYDQNGRLEQVSANDDTRSLTLAYDSQGRITSVTDQADRSVSYTYDEAGDLVTATDVLGGEWQYEYDSAHHLTQVIDPSSHTVERNQYDSQGRVVDQWDGLDHLIVGITYNSNGTRTIADALGDDETNTYDSRNTLTGDTDATGGTVSKTYDQNFRPATVTDASSHETQYIWSADGSNLTGIKDAAGNQTGISYDALNNPTQVVDPLNYQTSYTYSGKLLTQTTDALSGVTSYTYTTEGYLASVTDPLGHTTSYTYDSSGQHLTMTDALGNTWHYAYDDLGRLTSTTDPLGRVALTTYDAAGHVTQTIRNYDANRAANADNQYNITTTYIYDASGNQTSVTDTYGRTTHYTYDAAGRLVQTTDPDGHTTTNTYNNAGQLVTVTDALGHATHYTYDDAGRQIAVTDALGHTTHTAYNLDGTVASTTDADGNETQYTYDSMKRVITTTDAGGHTTHTSYDADGNVATTTDALGNVTHYEYDALGRQIEKIDPLNGTTQSFYDAAGNLEQTIDPKGNITTYAYDADNHLVSVTDALGNVTHYEYDDMGRRTAVVDAAGNRTTYTYDALDRTVSVTDPLNHITTTTYDALGHVLSSTDANGNTTSDAYDDLYRQTSQTDAHGDETTYTYDAAGNRVSVTDPDGNTTTTTYDDVNRPVEVTDPLSRITTTTYDADGNVLSTTDANGKTTSYTYDSLGRQVSATDPNDNVTHTAYDAAGQVTDKTDAKGVVTHYSYDALGRLTGVVENHQSGVSADSQTNVTTSYTYDANGNRLSITDGNGHTTHFTYDALNRLTEETDPLDHSWTYTYDVLGRRTSMTDANGATTTYRYDAAGHMTGIIYPGTNGAVSFSYDAAGRRTGMTDALGTTTWNYDTANRTTSITNPFDATVSYSYDANGNRTGLTYPDSKTVSYAYNSANQLTGVTDWDNQATHYTYDPVGRLLSILRPNGVDSAYTYNDGGELTQLQSTLNTTVLASYQYSYDANGNRTSVTEAVQQPKSDDIFSDSFESGDLSAWSSAQTDNGSLSVTSTSPIEGSHSLQATADSQNSLYVEDDTPQNDTHYDARFYFNPNSITATTGDSFTLFQGRDTNGDAVFQVNIRKADAGYEIQTVSLDDNQQSMESSWVPLTNELHSIELEWKTATAAGANDGYSTLYVDDTDVTGTTGVDNDTARVEDVEMGIISPSSSDFSGTVTFDDFASNRTGHIGIDSSIQLPSYGRIFRNAFESGDLSAWSSAQTDNGNLNVTSTDIHIEGNYSIEANVDGQNEMYVQDDSPQAESHYDARFYLDPDQLWASTGDSLVAFQGRDANGDPVFQVRLRKLYIGYEIGLVDYDNNQQEVESTWTPFISMLHAIEVEWQAASGPGANDGHSTLYVDNTAVATTTGVDNDTARVDDVEMGILALSSDNFGGKVFFDDFTSNRVGHIGLDANVTLPLIFSDGFESGDLSAWSSAQTDDGNLSVTSMSPIQGGYSLSATADGQNELYVQDDSPRADNIYHVRFYFDPNSITIPDGAYFDIFRGTGAGGTAFTIRLSKMDGDYFVKIVMMTDDNGTVESDWVPIYDAVNCIEFYWARAWSDTSNDGFTDLWEWVQVDGNTRWVRPNGVDNDTKSIDSVQMGILSPSSADISGTVYFDDFFSARIIDTWIGTDPNVPLPDYSQIFSNAFESGDLSKWSSAETDNGNLSVTSTTPIEGSYSLQATLDGQNEMYVRDDHPLDEPSYSARFYFDPKSVAIPEGDTFDIFEGAGSGGKAFAIRLGKFSGDYMIKAIIWDDNDDTTETDWTPIEIGPNCIELGWFRAWSADILDGRLQLWVNGNQIAYPGNIANYSKTVNYVEMGVLAPSSANISGTVSFDDFASNNWGDTRIGLDPNVTVPDYSQFVSDGFENGGTLAWSSTETDNGNLSVTAGAALDGDYGLRATVDGQNEMYVEDDRPTGEHYYHARFYFDPNSVDIPDGDTLDILRGSGMGGTAFSVRLGWVNDSYAVKVVMVADDNSTTESDWVPIDNGPSCIEIEWGRAWSDTSNNGYMNLWVNGTQMANPNGVDNDTKSIGYVQMGVLSASSANISGTVYFDDFASNNSYYIGPNQGVGQLLWNGFESGNLSAWSSAETDDRHLSVTTSAAMEGIYGLKGTVDGQNEMYVEDNSPAREVHYNARFYFDPNSVTIPSGDTFDIFKGTGLGGTAFAVRLGKISSDYVIKLVMWNDDNTTTESDWTPIESGPNCIEVEWARASDVDTSDGYMNLWVNDNQVANLNGVDNDTKSIGAVQAGVLSPSSSDIEGAVYFDDFASSRSGYIGLDSNVTLPDYSRLLADGFESGNMSGWSSTQTDGGNLSVTANAALEGDYGLQGAVDGQNEMYVEDDSPTGETDYHARFYIDPNSVDIPDGDTLDVFRGVGAGGTAFSVRLGWVNDGYALEVVLVNDDGSTAESDWHSIRNGPVCIEIDWSRATGANSGDGYIELSLDNGYTDGVYDSDNHTKWIDSVQMGVLSPSSDDISGTVDFDDFVSNNNGYIGADPNCYQLLADGFESGDTSAWSSVHTDNGNLTVTTDAAMEGDYGLQGIIDGQNEMYVEDDRPDRDASYHARFYFDPNSVDIPDGDSFDLLRAGGVGGEAFSVRLGWVDDGYAVKVVMVDDDNSTTESDWLPIEDGPNYIEIEWGRSWLMDSDDGYMDLWVNETGWENPTNVANGTKSIGYVQMGVLSPSSADISGTVYFDDFDSNNYSYIGEDENIQLMRSIPLVPEATPTVTNTLTSTPTGIPTEEATTQTPEATDTLTGTGTPADTGTATEEVITQTPEITTTPVSTDTLEDTDTPTVEATTQTPTPEDTDTPTVVEPTLTDTSSLTPTASATDSNGYLVPGESVFLAVARLLNPAGQMQDISIDMPTRTPTRTPTPLPSATLTGTNTPTRLPTATNTVTPQRATRTPAATITPQALNQLQPPVPSVLMGQLSMNAALESQAGNWSIDYTYDALNRLTAADYLNGNYYHYTYDAVGNRLSQVSLINGTQTTTAYVYDAANHLTSVGGVSYTWDANGNLTSDGVNTYTYDGANRLIAVNGQSSTTSYAYDGLGDRLQQTVGGQTTTYTLDINAALSQVLNDGTDTYLYGVDQIAQQNGTDTEYYLGDDLNSVRQLTNSVGDVTLARAYDPYGNTILNVGNEQTAYGYVGEFTDSTGMVYLRARYYDPDEGRFISKDTWSGDYTQPITLDAWLYANANPIMYTDHSGLCSAGESSCLEKALNLYHDYGWEVDTSSMPENEIDTILGAAKSIEKLFDRYGGDGQARMRGAMSPVQITHADFIFDYLGYHHVFGDIVYMVPGFNNESVVHEMGHILDNLTGIRTASIFGGGPSDDMARSLGVDPTQCFLRFKCPEYLDLLYKAGSEPPPTSYASNGPSEDFAETFRLLVFKPEGIPGTPKRSEWMKNLIEKESRTRPVYEGLPHEYLWFIPQPVPVPECTKLNNS